MTCVEYLDYLQQALDGRTDAVEAPVAEHLAACPACSQIHMAGRRLREGLRLVAAPQPPRDFAERVAARIVADNFNRRRQRRRWFAAALAASLLLAISAGYRWFNSNEPNPVKPGPVADADNNAPRESAITSSSREKVTGAGEAVASLSRKATEETVEQTRLLWPVATAPLSFDGIDLQTPLEPPAQSLREAGQSVSSGLEPVASSARRAMNLFWRDLPPVEPGKKQRS
jgi:anti-sigma factor RsiW